MTRFEKQIATFTACGILALVWIALGLPGVPRHTAPAAPVQVTQADAMPDIAGEIAGRIAADGCNVAHDAPRTWRVVSCDDTMGKKRP